MSIGAPARAPDTGLQHRALLYASDAEFLEGTIAFITGALAARQPVMVAMRVPKIDLLRARLGTDAAHVQFADMVELGRNPACIIPAWRDFVAPHLDAGRQPRGIGEPVWAERTPEELVEAQLHESLLDEAFADDPSWDLLCPYDAATLDDSVLEVARHTHQSAPSQRTATKPGDSSYAFTAPLPPPPDDAMVLAFDRASLDTVRRFVFGWAQHARIADRRAGDLAVAVSEAATNSVLHGGGHGELRAWLQDGQLVCEVRDDGTILDPLVGRSRPTTVQVSGRGLWLVNHLCDLTQVRSGPLGTAVRMSMSRRPPTLRSVIDASAARDP